MLIERHLLDGWSFHPASDVAMVLLYQLAHRRCYGRRTGVLAKTEAGAKGWEGAIDSCFQDARSDWQHYIRSSCYLHVACAAMGRSYICLVKSKNNCP